LKVDVFDDDHGAVVDLKSDDTLGSLHLPNMAEFVKKAGEEPVAFNLGAALDDGKQPPAGAQLFLQLKWFNMASELNRHDGDAPMHVLCLKIDQITDVPMGVGEAFKVHLRLKGANEPIKSVQGWPKGCVVTLQDLHQVRKLHSKNMEAKDIADVMMLEESLVSEILMANIRPRSASGRHRSSSQLEREHDHELIAQVQDCRNKMEQSRNPQFEDVLRLLLPDVNVTAVVELVNTNKTPEVIAHFDIDVAKQLGGGPLEGPFDFVQVPKPEDRHLHHAATSPSKSNLQSDLKMRLEGTAQIHPLLQDKFPHIQADA